MNAASAEPAGWSNRSWFWTLSLVFAVHLALVWWLCEPKNAPPPASLAAPVLRLGSDAMARAHFSGLAPLSDPALLALPNPHGFSGEAWLKMRPFPYALSNRLESPRWLAAAPNNLGSDFLRFVETNLPQTLLFVEKPAPLFSQARTTLVPMRIQAALLIEGDLGGRRLISTNRLPEPDLGEMASSCTVRLGVDAAGYTLSPAIRFGFGSGYPELDKKALSFAKAARFSPIRTGEAAEVSARESVTFGALVFHWSLVPGTETNPPAAKPSSL